MASRLASHKQLRAPWQATPSLTLPKCSWQYLAPHSAQKHLQCRVGHLQPTATVAKTPCLLGNGQQFTSSHLSSDSKSYSSSVITTAAAAAAAVITAGVDASADIEQQQLNADQKPLKMVLCVNQSLKMGKGKIGAQCAHAAIGVVLQLLATDLDLYMQWEQCGQRKIVVKVDDAQSMEVLAGSAAAAGLPRYIMKDAGRTQVAPGSQTVLAIGPGTEAEIDRLTGHLHLL